MRPGTFSFREATDERSELFPPYLSPWCWREHGTYRGWNRLRVWGDEAKAARGPSEAPVRLAVLFSGNGFHGREWWAHGSGRNMELGQVLAPLADFRERMLFIRGLYQRRGAKRATSTARRRATCFPAHRWPPAARSARARASTSCWREPRAIDQGAQPGARLREVESVGAQELLDALQLAHLVDLADDTDAAGALSGLGLRPVVPGRSQARRQERARRRAFRRPRLPPRDQLGRSAQARRIPRLGARGRAANRERPAAAASCKAGGRRSKSRIFPAPPTEFPRTSASTCG